MRLAVCQQENLSAKEDLTCQSLRQAWISVYQWGAGDWACEVVPVAADCGILWRKHGAQERYSTGPAPLDLCQQAAGGWPHSVRLQHTQIFFKMLTGMAITLDVAASGIMDNDKAMMKANDAVADAPGDQDSIKSRFAGSSQADVALIMSPCDGNSKVQQSCKAGGFLARRQVRGRPLPCTA